MGRVFQARYDGWCRACGDEIEAGDDVVYSETDGGVVHERCSSEED